MNTRFFLPMILSLVLAAASHPGVLSAADHSGHGGHGGHGGGQSERKAPAEKPRNATYTGVGVIRTVDAAAGKISISHEPIPALSWPAMTMHFALETPSLLNGLKVGDKARFDFRQQDAVSTILDIEVLR